MNYSKEWLTKKEFEQIVNNPEISRRDEIIISILYYCALRVSEMAALKVKDIDIEKCTLTLWQLKKSDHPELIPVPAHLVKQINQWVREQNKKPTDHLIHSQKGGNRIYGIIEKNGLKANGRKNLTTHTFRRPRATHLLDAGLPIEKVSRILRHNRPESTMTYPRFREDMLKNFNRRFKKRHRKK